MTILLVDDDRNCMELWARMLHGLRADILFAASVQEAMQRMGTIPPPDLVLLDLKLPPYGPEHTLSAVNAFREFNPNLAVVAISGMTLDAILQVVASVGIPIEATLTKDDSLSQANLLEAVQRALANKVGKGDFRDTMRVLETASSIIEQKRKTQPLKP